MASEMKFEEALKRLERIVQDLEDGDLPLDEACGKYEEGIRLSRTCAKKLETAKKKIEILLKNEDGSVELKEFDERKARLPDGKTPAVGQVREEEKPQEANRKRKVKTGPEEELL